jgi:DNA (cytosine-5)-methyltransferase 1
VNRKTISRWENRQIPLPLYMEPALSEILQGICESPTHDSSLTFIDLFAGIGGIRKGFEAAGGRAILTSEWDPWTQKTYAANFGDENTLVGDIVGFPTGTFPIMTCFWLGFLASRSPLRGEQEELARSAAWV